MLSLVLLNKDGRSNSVFSGCLQFLFNSSYIICQNHKILSLMELYKNLSMSCEICLGCATEMKNNKLKQWWLKVDYEHDKKKVWRRAYTYLQYLLLGHFHKSGFVLINQDLRTFSLFNSNHFTWAKKCQRASCQKWNLRWQFSKNFIFPNIQLKGVVSRIPRFKNLSDHINRFLMW